MGIVSLGVLFYQIIVAAIIIYAASKGRKYLVLSLILAVLWTLSHVFYPPLMLLQFGTIIGSGVYGYKKAQNLEAANAVIVQKDGQWKKRNS